MASQPLRAARREVERRFEALAAHAPVGIVMHDTAGNCIYINRRGCEIAGVAAKDALGQGLKRALHPADRERVLRERARAVENDGVFEAEFRFRSPDGKITWVAMNSAPLPGEIGKPESRIGAISDITDRRLAEQALRESRQRLEELLDERERLVQDVHDGCIQSLYAIGLNLRACRRSLEGNPKAAGIIDSATANLNLVIQELRSSISGHGPQRISGCDLGREIEAAVKANGSEGLAFTLDIDAATAHALTPKQALHVLQIAREAISNAQRHARAKQGRISLRVHDRHVRLEIRDDGVGFDPQAPGKDGMGLRHIDARARVLGGRSRIVSSPNNGTLVVVQLPVTG